MSTNAPSKNSAKKLNVDWDVQAQHALYREDGTWYNRLKTFPGALFDANGYVLFATEEDYLQCAQLHILKQTTCRSGISSIPSYVRVIEGSSQALDLDSEEAKAASRAESTVNRIIRDSPLARRIKNLHEDECQICGLTLVLFDGKRYSEAHHIKPLGIKHNGPDMASNLLCVCPNCHAQLDYGAIELNLEELHASTEHQIKNEYIDYHNSKIYKGAHHDK